MQPLIELVTNATWYTHISFMQVKKRKNKSWTVIVGSVMNDPGDPIMKEYLEWWREYDDKT